jgi:hypothetical protein
MLARIFGGLMALTVATPVAAQGSFDDWREPVVVEFELAGALNGERSRELRRGRIELGPRESFTVQVDPYDQRGRRSPADRFQMGAELQRECDGRISMSGPYAGDLEFTAGRGRVRCEVVLYVPGNLNLDHVLEFDVTGMGTGNYTRRQAEEVVERLYRAVLQREVDRGSRASAVAEVQAGNLTNQVNALISSREFSEVHSRSQPADLLEAFYAGILERTPDSAGAGDYLREISRERHEETIMNLIQSGEFETSLPTRWDTTDSPEACREHQQPMFRLSGVSNVSASAQGALY